MTGARRGLLGGVGGALRLPLAVLGPALIIFVSSSVDLLRRNSEYFGDSLSNTLPFLLVGSIYLLIGVIVYRLRHKSNIFRGAFYAYLLSGPFWVICFAMADLTGKSALIGFAILAAMGGAYTAHAKKLAEPLVTVLSVFSLTMLASTVFNALQIRQADTVAREREHRGFEREDPVGRNAAAGTLPDIYHIVFDEFQTDMFAAVLDADLKDKLRGVTWFPDSTTPFGRTEMALASLFSGVPYAYREPPLKYISKAFISKQSMLMQLKSVGYETISFLHQVYPRGSQSPFDQSYFHKDIESSIPATERRALFKSLWLYAFLPKFFTRHVLPEHHFQQLASQTLLPDDAPFLSLMSFRRFLEWEGATDRKGGRYIFIHLILPHFPNVLAADCSYQPGLKTNIVDQTSCTVHALVEFLDFLEDKGRFNDSLILMHADHGSRYLFDDGKLQNANDGFYGPGWSWARSRPLVLIKPAGVDRKQGFVIDERAMDLFDLFPTVFENLGKSPGVPLVGSSLLAEPAARKQRFYHFYDKDHARIVDGAITRFKIVDHAIVFDTEVSVPK